MMLIINYLFWLKNRCFSKNSCRGLLYPSIINILRSNCLQYEIGVLKNLAYWKSGTQDAKVGSWTQDPQVGPYAGTLRWDPMV